MNSIFTMFDILRLRRGPQDLPADGQTVVFWIGAALVIGLAIGIPLHGTTGALLLNGVDLAVLYAFVLLALRLRGVGDRTLQTYVAMVGTGALLGILMALLMFLQGPVADPEEASALLLVLLLGLLGWLLLVFGHILQNALALASRLFGMFIALGYVVISSVVTQLMLEIMG